MPGKRVWISQQPALLSKTLFLFYEAELSSGSVGGTALAVLGDHANHEALSLRVLWYPVRVSACSTCPLL